MPSITKITYFCIAFLFAPPRLAITPQGGTGLFPFSRKEETPIPLLLNWSTLSHSKSVPALKDQGHFISKFKFDRKIERRRLKVTK
jgi:hypothetical protein